MSKVNFWNKVRAYLLLT